MDALEVLEEVHVTEGVRRKNGQVALRLAQVLTKDEK
jgi:hypothetical protein